MDSPRNRRVVGPTALGLLALLWLSATHARSDVAVVEEVGPDVEADSGGPQPTLPEQKSAASGESKRILGATSVLQEVTTGVELRARIDTGARSCSLHVDEIEIEDGSTAMRKNVGKDIKFRIVDDDGEGHWVESTIFDTVLIKNPSVKKKQRRYLVWLTLRADGLEKRVLVSLSDRSHLEFPLLIGRNFLSGDFLVDVSINGDNQPTPN